MPESNTNIQISEELKYITTELYVKVNEIEDIVPKLEEKIVTLSSSTNITDLCQLKDNLAAYESIASDISEISSKASALISEFESAVSRYSEMVYMYAAEIVMKAIEITKLRVKVLGLSITKEITKMSRDTFIRMLDGESSTAVVFITPQITLMSGIATGISAVLSVLGALLALIKGLAPMSVDSGGMSLLPTPKSLKSVHMAVNNPGGSICDNLGQEIEIMLSNIERGLDVSENTEKMAKVAAGASAGASSVVSEGRISVGNLGKFKVISRTEIMDAVNTVILSMGMAEPLPRYEKLSIVNPRYMLWLVTGFVPSGHNAFGIPGMS